MAVMDIHHPDILEFIECKRTEGEIHNFNISVGVSDEFMKAVETGDSYALRAKENPSDPSCSETEVGRLDAREVFSQIIQGSWRNGEPGMVFLDRINNDIGHNDSNVVIACLKCNLKRRTTDADKFKFTKQMKIIKKFWLHQFQCGSVYRI